MMENLALPQKCCTEI